MRYAKVDIETGSREVTQDIGDNDPTLKFILRDGFLPYEEESEPDEAELVDFESYELRFRVGSDKIEGYYEKVAVNTEKVKMRIAKLKAELTATDYKVVKNQELQSAGLACAYDPELLHSEREALREEIRGLEIYTE